MNIVNVNNNYHTKYYRTKYDLIFSCALTVLLFMSTVFPHSFASEQEESASEVTVIYFYFNACEACNDEQAFSDRVNIILGDEKNDVNIKHILHNTFHTGNYNLLQEYYKDYGVPENQRINSGIVFIDNEYIIDNKDFDQLFKAVFLKVKNSNGKKPDTAMSINKGKSGKDDTVKLKLPVISDSNPDSDSLVVYFYISPCESCEEVQSFLHEMDREYVINLNGKKIMSRLDVEKYNVNDSGNLALIRRYFEVYDVPESKQQTPIVFIGNKYLSGTDEIKANLIGDIKGGMGVYTSMPDSLLAANIGKADESLGLRAVGVFLAGLINGMNPCSVSMLLFFLSLIAIKPSRVLRLGFAFITGKLIAYIAIGTIFFNVLGRIDASLFTTFQKTLKIVLLAVAALLVLLNISDILASKKGKYGEIILQLPAGLRNLNHKMIKKAALIDNYKILLPVSFGLGVAVSFGELLCTGQIYLATIISLLHYRSTFNLQVIGYFMLYGAALVLPLVILTVIIYKGKGIFDVTDAVREKLPVIKLVNAFVFLMFIIAILLFY